MDDEIEDIVGEVKYTDSQKSIATRSSPMYSPDFTDSSSDKQNSTGKETYVIECDSEDPEDNDKQFALHECVSIFNGDVQSSSVCEPSDGTSVVSARCGPSQTITKCASTSYHTIIAQEICTQTSRTIIELAEMDGKVKRITDNNSLQTQTSRMSVTENKTVEYRIEVTNMHEHYEIDDAHKSVAKLKQEMFFNENIEPIVEYFNYEPSPPQKPKLENVTCNQLLHALEDNSSRLVTTGTDNEATEDQYRSDSSSDCESSDKGTKGVRDDCSNGLTEDRTILFICSSSEKDSNQASDIEEDSLMTDRQKSNVDVKELHDKLFKTEEVHMLERYVEPNIWRYGTLTPLSEETNLKKESNLNMNESSVGKKFDNQNVDIDEEEDLLFTLTAGLKVKAFKDNDAVKTPFKLPPIKNNSCPSSPHLNSLFSKSKLNKAGTLPSVYERPLHQDRWEIGTKDLASGESAHITDRSKSPTKKTILIQLPPIHGEAPIIPLISTKEESFQCDLPPHTKSAVLPENSDGICIKEKIKELKMGSKRSWSKCSSFSRVSSRAGSPTKGLYEGHGILDRGCEAVCVDLLRRMRSTSWFEVVEALEDLPKVLDKFWDNITETRIADLVRQVNSLVESPRPQVAKIACSTAADILKNTHFTRKPDFYETVTILLAKTGSYSRVVRRAANLALDHIVCGVEMSHAVTALCVHGVGHKNALVRCAAARLLVVCCALAGGGRALLRTRPPSAASARKHVLRSLAALLSDKSTDTRKYAERLYAMLRPLTNFEAYYLMDVDVELASKQMKKYDQLLFVPPKTR